MSAIFKSRFCVKIAPSLGLANLHFVLRFWADTSGAKMRFIASQMPNNRCLRLLVCASNLPYIYAFLCKFIATSSFLNF